MQVISCSLATGALSHGKGGHPYVLSKTPGMELPKYLFDSGSIKSQNLKPIVPCCLF